MAFKAHTTFKARSIPEVTTLVDEVYLGDDGIECIRRVKKNVNSLVPVIDAVDNQLVNQINAGKSIRKVSTYIDSNDRFDTERILENIPRETSSTSEN